jgi:hypothetical protein
MSELAVRGGSESRRTIPPAAINGTHLHPSADRQGMSSSKLFQIRRLRRSKKKAILRAQSAAL